MQRTQPLRMGAVRGDMFWSGGNKMLRWLTPLLSASALSLVLFMLLCRLPHYSMQDVGAWTLSATGLYVPEKLGPLTYVYTDGDAWINFPQTGAGNFMLDLRLGGPSGAVPAVAQLGSTRQQVDVRGLQDLRVYHLLVPSVESGDVRLHLGSTTSLVGADPRPLGVLIDWIALRSVGAVGPPAAALLSMPLALTLLWLAMAPLAAAYRWKVLALGLLGAAMCASFIVVWSRVPLQVVWLGLGVAAAMGMLLARVEAPDRGTTARRVALVVSIILLWRVSLWGVGAVGLHYGQEVYRYAKELSSGFSKTISEHGGFVWGALADAWMQWDSEHYQAIAVDGYAYYGTDDRRYSNIAFFPLYPLLVRVLLPLTGGDAAVAALLVAHLAMIAASVVLYDLVCHDFGHLAAYRTLLMLLLFPTSFFFVAGYSESLALVLAAASVWAMRRERWWLAGLAGMLLTLARLPGIAIAPVLAVSYLHQRRWRWRAVGPDVLAALLPLLGLALFMLYQWWRFETPFAFLLAQERWNNGMMPPWHMPAQIIDDIRHSPDWEMASLRLVVWAMFIGLTILALRRLPLSYSLTAMLLLLPPYLANQTGSLIRHVLIAFPAFVALAVLGGRLWVRWLAISIMLPLLVMLTLLFVNALWIA